MAYVSKETKAKIVNALFKTGAKAEGFSWTVGVRDHSVLRVKIWKYPDWFVMAGGKNSLFNIAINEQEYGLSLNTYHPKMYFDDTPEGQKSLEWIEKFIAAMKTDWWDESDAMTDYFNTAWYIELLLMKPKD